MSNVVVVQADRGQDLRWPRLVMAKPKVAVARPRVAMAKSKVATAQVHQRHIICPFPESQALPFNVCLGH